MQRFLLLLLLIASTCLSAQGVIKPHLHPEQGGPKTDLSQVRLQRPPVTSVPAAARNFFTPQSAQYRTWPAALLPTGEAASAEIRWLRDPETGLVLYAQGRPASLGTPRSGMAADAEVYLAELAKGLYVKEGAEAFVLRSLETDELGMTHARFYQQYQGVPIFGTDFYLHGADRGFDRFNGRAYPTPRLASVQPKLSATAAVGLARKALEAKTNFVELQGEKLQWIDGAQREQRLVIYPVDGKAGSERLAWEVELWPNLSDHYTLLIDAETGAVLNSFSHVCGFYGHLAKHLPTAPPPPDGPATANMPDLGNTNRLINTYSLNDTFFLLDGSRQMFRNQNGELSGFLLTFDGRNNSPSLNSFDPFPVFSLNNGGWSRTAVSAHYNAGVAYEYYRQTFSRNGIDDEGGNIYSFINITEDDGTGMDNAFWNGRAMFYGNGNQAFTALARALDVAGHEMTHGVIQAEADLLYQEQHGAINESMADVFGYLIEGESGDWRLGEDVVRTQFFPSGALRNMQNPNNGGQPNNHYWQPAHMNQYQDLPVDEDNDQGGVHINSGIPNRAFYLFATNPSVGDAKAARVYYRALQRYLTRSSRFIDLRLAIEQAAADLHGANSPEVAAARAAFDGVGISGGQGGNYQGDLPVNPGTRYLLLSNVNQSAVYLASESGNLLSNPLLNIGIASKPSVTDDGSFIVFVDNSQRLRFYDAATNQTGFLENNPQSVWRNIAISRDGARIAALTTDYDNGLFVYDFESGQGQTFDLYNPTTVQGVSTGDVVYADALEWETNGEYVMYDVLSELSSAFGERIEFWDIGFLHAWDIDRDQLGDGSILKLFSSLPEGLSIGNPSFAKNSPYVIAFDLINEDDGSYQLVAQNIETGEGNAIFNNTRLGFPNFGVGDDRLVFDAQTQAGAPVLATIGLGANKITASGQAGILFDNGHWGVYFADGERILTGTDEPGDEAALQVSPNPFMETLQLSWPADLSGPVQLKLLNSLGQAVWQTRLGGDHSASLTPPAYLPKGNYWLQLHGQDGRRWVKPVVKG